MFITVYYYIHPMQPGFTWMDRILGRGLRRDCPVAGADRNDRGPSTGSGRTARWAQRDCRVAALLAMTGVLRRAQDERAGQPHPRIKYGAGSNPLPSRERGCPSTGSGRTGAVGAARLPRRCASRNDRGPSTGSGRTGGSPSPPYQVRGRLQPSHIKGDGMSFDGLRTNGGGGRSEIAASQGFIR